ncbi:NAD(P)H-dependent oxidoreductase [Streptomyces sp. NPDC055134]
MNSSCCATTTRSFGSPHGLALGAACVEILDGSGADLRFAYGIDGTALRGKALRLVTSAGGTSDSYALDGFNRFTLAELRAPIAAMVHLAGMCLAEPLVLREARTVCDEDLTLHAKHYRALLTA